MSSGRACWLVAIVALVCGAFPGPQAPAANAEQAAVAASTAFAVDFYKTMAGDGGQSNLFVSPHSVSAILALTSAGARGSTASQMQRVLHVADTAGHHAGVSEVMRRLLDTQNGARPYSLSVANSLWLSPLYTLRPEFLSVAERNYAAAAYGADFPRSADPERVRINKWVEEKTQSRITDLIPDAADFSGLVASGPRIWIDEVFHKAFVAVDETGTEAAAATAGVMAGSAQPAEPFTFRADHPFLFAIRFEPTGSILFMGRITNPAAP